MTRVAIGFTSPSYLQTPPYHPGASYPELPFSEVSVAPNAPYALLRETFRMLGLDAAHHGTAGWNPLREIVRPGDTVLLKPNFVLSHNASGGPLDAVVTHPSILRALTDYVYVALRGEGRIVIADAPQMDCDWNELMKYQRLDAIQEFYHSRFKFPIEVYDLRDFELTDRRKDPLPTNRRARPGDPAGPVRVNLGCKSHFHGLPGSNYYGADFDRSETLRHHSGELHEYSISRTVLSADVFLSVPKMKVHKKVGVTLNLKGLVGINTCKNFLVHYRIGSPSQGGDQVPDGLPMADRLLLRWRRALSDALLVRGGALGSAFYSFALAGYRAFLRPFLRISTATGYQDGGNWHGNDSAWRMTADLAKIFFFADKDGVLRETQQRRMFCVIDGIVGGERNGPLAPDAKYGGALVVGENPIAVDLVTTRLMGFDLEKVKQLSILRDPRFDFGVRGPSDIEVLAEDPEVCRMFQSAARFLAFVPHPGWMGHLEVPGQAERRTT